MADWTYESAKRQRDLLDAEVSRLSKVLAAFPKSGPLGLVPDAIKFGAEYGAAKSAFDTAFQRLRDFNSGFLKAFKLDIAAERRLSRLISDDRTDARTDARTTPPVA